MRIRTGHKPEDWTPNTPSYSGSIPIRGSLVVGAPGPVEQARINSRASANVARKRRSDARKAAVA